MTPIGLICPILWVEILMGKLLKRASLNRLYLWDFPMTHHLLSNCYAIISIWIFTTQQVVFVVMSDPQPPSLLSGYYRTSSIWHV